MPLPLTHWKIDNLGTSASEKYTHIFKDKICYDKCLYEWCLKWGGGQKAWKLNNWRGEGRERYIWKKVGWSGRVIFEVGGGEGDRMPKNWISVEEGRGCYIWKNLEGGGGAGPPLPPLLIRACMKMITKHYSKRMKVYGNQKRVTYPPSSTNCMLCRLMKTLTILDVSYMIYGNLCWTLTESCFAHGPTFKSKWTILLWIMHSVAI